MSCNYTLTDLGVESGFVNSSANACSADGSVTVGVLDNPVPGGIQRAFTHTDGGGYVLLSPSGSNDGSVAYDVSENGSVTVGASSDSIIIGPNSIATYWVNNGSPNVIPFGTSVDRSRCIEVSADGTVITGDRRLPVNHVFHYTVSTSILIDIGDLASGSSPTRFPVLSRNGTTIVGESATSGGDAHAFRWTLLSMTDLGTLGGTSSRAYDVSDNGNLVIGASKINSGDDLHAFYWISGSGMIDITPSLPAGSSSYAFCVSGNGNIIWGYIQDASNNRILYRYVVNTNTLTTYGQYTDQISDVWCCSQDGCVVAGTYDSTVVAFRYSDAEGFVTIGTLPTGTGSNLWGLNSISEDGKVVVGVANINNAPIVRAFKHVANCPFGFCSNGGGPSTENGVDPAAARCLTCDVCATPNPQTGVHDSSRVTEFREGRVIRDYVLAAGCQARPTPVFASYADYMKYLNASLRH